MSREPQTLANLKEAERIKRLGFKTKLHSMPEMKQYVDFQLEKGVSIRQIGREIIDKFGKEVAPSQTALNSYVKKHWLPHNSVTVTPTGAAAIRDFDALKKLREEIEDIDGRIKEFLKKEQVTGFPVSEIRRYRELKVNALKEFILLGIRLGVIQGELTPEMTVGQMNIGNFGVTGDVAADSSENMPVTLDEMFKYKAAKRAYANSHTKPAVPAKRARVQAKVVPDGA